jgi:molecular chaperone GrpE
MPSDNEDILAGGKAQDVKDVSGTAETDDAMSGLSGLDDNSEEESAARVNAAKAFFRAMYAGGEVDAEQYGMNVGTVKSSNARGVCLSCDNLSAQVEQLEAKSNELEGLYKRMAADFENYRKRIEREREELSNMGVQKAIEAILPALDDLDRAQTSFTQNSEIKNVIESMKLIADRFTRCLEQIGVKPLNAVGQTFDPRLHQPVQQVKAPELPDGSIAHDLRRGYALGDKVIRPALVNVVGNEGDTVESSVVEKADEQENS